MGIMVLVICAIFIIVVGGLLFKDAVKSKERNKEEGKKSIKSNNITKGVKDFKDKQKEELSKHILDSQDILDFKEILVCNEETGLIQYDNNTYIGIIEIQGINFNLLSVDERLMLEENFGELLNGIEFPIQFYIQSRKVDLDKYINKYQESINKIEKEIDNLKNNENISANDIENKNSQLIYGKTFMNYFVQRTVNANLLERKYYIVVKYVHNTSNFEHKLNDYEILTTAYNDISNKAALIIDSLYRNNLKSNLLSAIGLGEVLYASYNRECASELKFQNVVNSNYSHLFTTSKPVQIKKIEQEIVNSVEREQELIKDLEVLQKEVEKQNHEII
ncbi:hypothetical protein FDB39_17215 [Clostridium botulinum]|nr:hypothetical protein [Clostridium botulinum]